MFSPSIIFSIPEVEESDGQDLGLRRCEVTGKAEHKLCLALGSADLILAALSGVIYTKKLLLAEVS